jgi:hypothetical protein
MAKQLRAQIDIHASPKRVWQVLTDFASYPQGNPFMTRAAGNPARAVWAFAHGMVQLELARRFRPVPTSTPPGRRESPPPGPA